MDYAKSFTFVFDDPRWKEKIAIGTGLVLVSFLLSVILIGILGLLILGGYSIRLLQNVRKGEEHPLPEWNDWGGDFMRGLKYLVVGIVWVLPVIVFAIPLAIGGIISDGSGAAEFNGAAEFIGASILFCGSCLMFLYGLFVALAAPGFTIAFSSDEQISSGLQITRIWQWTQANIGQVVVAVLVLLLAQAVIGLAGTITGTLLCGIGLVVTLPLATLATSIYQHHVYGQLAVNFPYVAAILPAFPELESATEDIPAEEVDKAGEEDDKV